SKEVAFVLRFSRARAVVVRREFGGFDYKGMLEELRGDLPDLQHVIIAGGERNRGAVTEATRAALAARRPKPDDICRMAFTSGTTGDPKAVVHTHNTSNCTARSSARDQRMDERSAMLLFLPVGLNWGLGCTKQSLFAGCKIVYMEKFDAVRVLELVERERITHVVTAPASLVALIDAATARA